VLAHVINNNHNSGLLDIHFIAANNPANDATRNNTPPYSLPPTQAIPLPQPQSTTHSRHELTRHCIPRTTAATNAPNLDPFDIHSTQLLQPHTQNTNYINMLPSTQAIHPELMDTSHALPREMQNITTTQSQTYTTRTRRRRVPPPKHTA
jgi:hypothetical protein